LQVRYHIWLPKLSTKEFEDMVQQYVDVSLSLILFSTLGLVACIVDSCFFLVSLGFMSVMDLHLLFVQVAIHLLCHTCMGSEKGGFDDTHVLSLGGH
jgi:hypothetical protein